jgi:tRNA-dihydrouridine synthase B
MEEQEMNFSSGEVDLDTIREVKNAVKIPVIGNGNINSYEDAVHMFEYTGCNGIMIGRGALGRPWIFQELTTKTFAIENTEILKTIIEHIKLETEYLGEKVGIKHMRKHIAWYIKGMKDATKIRERVNTIETRKELEECLIEFILTLHRHL